MNTSLKTYGFTLIELSIVLVIIGLLVGGVLVGRDLIKAAEARAQIAQIEKFQQAVNSFRGKYAYLPGDIPNSEAIKFGFLARNSIIHSGNGLLEGNFSYLSGKDLLFWRDLSDAKLINGSFGKDLQDSTFFVPESSFQAYFPNAIISSDSYVYAYTINNNNYYGVSAPLGNSSSGFHSKTSMTVQQAYNIDKKMDDGIPMAGNVQAVYFNYFFFPSVDPITGDGTQTTFGGIITANDCQTEDCVQGTPNTPDQDCFVTNQNYNISYPNNVNCALSFKFQ